MSVRETQWRGPQVVAKVDMLMPAGLSPLETASSLLFGVENGAFPRADRAALPPAVALENSLARALRRPPCVIAFSGGRDSSLLLAAAAAAARREGLPAPVPVTLRFPLAAATHESRWQEQVVRYLRLDEWVRIDLSDELDFIGPVARRLLLEHGPLFPPNAHLIVPMINRAAGGTLVSGLGGDEIFGLWHRRRLADVAAHRARPSWRDAPRLAGAVAPRGIRQAVLRRRYRRESLPWLRERAQVELDARQLAAQAWAPARWDRHVVGVAQARSVRLAVRDVGLVAREANVEFHAPLVEPDFAAALARAGGWRGFGGRGATLRALFGHLLAPDVLSRRGKAVFNDVFFTGEARRFARCWSGGGLDESVVDPEALRHTWLEPLVDYRSALLLQSAWLHDHGAGRC